MCFNEITEQPAAPKSSNFHKDAAAAAFTLGGPFQIKDGGVKLLTNFLGAGDKTVFLGGRQ